MFVGLRVADSIHLLRPVGVAIQGSLLYLNWALMAGRLLPKKMLPAPPLGSSSGATSVSGGVSAPAPVDQPSYLLVTLEGDDDTK